MKLISHLLKKEFFSYNIRVSAIKDCVPALEEAVSEEKVFRERITAENQRLKIQSLQAFQSSSISSTVANSYPFACMISISSKAASTEDW